ncbi:MAG: Ig-like domain-containing protein [Bacteroidales bacterium]|nr:Ig-like domain-containing protein [Bacteroidales bacterium]
MKKIFSLGLAALMSASLVAAEPATLVWNGAAGDSIWNTESANWLEGEMATPWVEGSVAAIAPDSLGAEQRYIKVYDSINVANFLFDSPQNYTLISATDSVDKGVHGDFLFVKKGTGTLKLQGQDFWFWPAQGTVIEAGTIEVAGPAAASNNIEEQVLGPQVTLKNGATLTFNTNTTDKHGYEDIKTDLIIEDGAEVTVNFDRNLVHTGKLVGGKDVVFNMGLKYLREHFMGNWSEFEGRINMTPWEPLDGTGNAFFIMCDTLGIAEYDADGNYLATYPAAASPIDSTKVKDLGYSYTKRVPLGYPKAHIHLNDKAYLYTGGNMSNSAASSAYPSTDITVCHVGALSGTAASVLGAGGQQRGSFEANWYIGGLNTNEVFEGTINNSGYKKNAKATHIHKVGTGDWRLTNAKLTNVGNYSVEEGSLTILGQVTTTSSVIVKEGASLKGNPVFTAAGTAEIAGMLEPGDSTLNNSIGAIEFQNANVNIKETAVIKIGLGQGRSDQVVYYGTTTLSAGSKIEFFVEENTVKAGDQFRILVPYQDNANASVLDEGCEVVCQEGLEIDYTNLFADPQWVEGEEKAICGTITVISNTAQGIYGSEAAKVKEMTPAEGAYVGTSGAIVLTYDKEVLRGTGDITMGGVAFEPVIKENVVTINFKGLSTEVEGYELIIPEGAILDAYDNAATKAYKASFLLDKVNPTFVEQSVANDTEISWADGKITLTFDENVKVADAKAFTINKTQWEMVKPVANGKTIELNYVALNFETAYTVNIAEGAITDAVGNPAAALTLNFKTAGYDKTMDDSTALNGKAHTTLPIEQYPLTAGDGGAYPLWVQNKEGNFAEGTGVTWTSNNSGNKVMAAFTGDAQALYVWAKATGKEMLLTIQESPAEAGVVTWRTIREINDWDLGENERRFEFALTPGCRFIKIKPSQASATSSIIITGYKVDNKPVAIENADASEVMAYQVSGGLMLSGLTAGNKVEVFNLSGNRVAMFQAEGTELYVPAEGFVLIKVTAQDGAKVMKAIVK